jgi:MFS family permease
MASRIPHEGPLDAYRRAVGVPQARRLMMCGFVGRLREGGIGLALVLLVRHGGGSFTFAGLVGAVFLLAAASCRPLQGRWMDQTSHHRVLVATSALNSALLVMIAVVATVNVGRFALLVAVAVAGASLPALSATMRALWPLVLPGEADAAFALDSLLYELAIVIGPALVGLISTILNPAVAVVVLAIVGLGGTLGVAMAPASRVTRPPQSNHGRASPLTPSIRRLLSIAFFFGFAVGPITVSLTAIATEHHASKVSGPLISALALGSMLGALHYGAHAWKLSLPTRLSAYAGALTIGLVVLAATATNLLVIAPELVVAGIALAPTITILAVCVNEMAPNGTVTETFAWISFATPCGSAAAQALAGVLAAGPGPRWGLLESAIGAGAATAIAMLSRRHLTSSAILG